MKFTSFLLALLFVAGLMGCKNDDNNEPQQAPAVLDTVTNRVQLSLDTLNNALIASVATLAGRADTATIRAELQQLYAGSTIAKEVAFVNPQGIMQIIEPPAYYSFEGTDFSSDTSIMGVINGHKNIFTSYFQAIEGFDAVAYIFSIYNGTASLGALEALFTPAGLIGRIASPLVSAPNEIWVMETNGVLIYDPDVTGDGKNIFTDPYFATFPDFITACHTIVQEESGQTTYTFYKTGTTTPVVKIAWWKTIHIYGNAWKIVWSQEK
jgi:hypothetical protein